MKTVWKPLELHTQKTLNEFLAQESSADRMTRLRTELLVLRMAKDLISLEDNWTQYAFARDVSGMAVSTTDESACQFCLVGAVLRSCNYHDMDSTILLTQMTKSVSELKYESLDGFNDFTNHERVVGFLLNQILIGQTELNSLTALRGDQR